MDIPYLMDSGDESLRLEIKTDPAAIEAQALRAGLQPGMRVADICCGSGITTAVLSKLAGPAGKTVGIDGSAERIAHARRKYGSRNTRFEQRDIRADLGGREKFDFVWVRFALEYYRREAFEIVKNISTLVADGGILCLLDLDHNCLNHYGMSPRLEKALQAAIKVLEERSNFDPYAGRKLYSHLYLLGYQNIEASVEAHHLIYGPLRQIDIYNWVKKIEVISGKVDISLPGYDGTDEAGEGRDIDAFLADFKTFFSSPRRFTYTPIIGCWGTRRGGEQSYG